MPQGIARPEMENCTYPDETQAGLPAGKVGIIHIVGPCAPNPRRHRKPSADEAVETKPCEQLCFPCSANLAKLCD